MRTKTLTCDEVLERLYRAVDAMREVCEPEFVVLFGSYAYGEPHEGSDVDVLVVYPDETNEEERRNAGSVLHQVFGTGLEVHPCTLSQWREALLKRNWFVAEITQKGFPLFSRREWNEVLREVQTLMSQSQNLYPHEWLDWVEDDWWVVQRALDEGRVFVAAYHLRQAVEKWLKAFLLYHGWQLERTHDLEKFACGSSQARTKFAAISSHVPSGQVFHRCPLSRTSISTDGGRVAKSMVTTSISVA